MSVQVAPTQAALAILLGMATLGLSDNLVGFITYDSSLWQYHLLRSTMALIMLALGVALGFGALLPKRWGAVGARSAFQAVALLIYFGCVAIMPIGVVVAGFFTAPLFVALIAAVFQNKPIGAIRSVAIGMGFLGALLVIRPDPANLSLVNFLPIIAGLFYAIGAVATRAWCEGESTVALSASFFVALAIAGAVGSLVLPGTGIGADGFSARGWMPLTLNNLFWIAAQAVGAMIGIVCIFRGYQIGEASSVAVFEYSLLIFASGWAWYLWGQAVPALALLGMGLIVSSGAIVALRSDP